MHVLIIGAGLLGVTTAYFLRRAGLEVTVFERREGPALETSFANGGIIQAGCPDPWNYPGVTRALLSALMAGIGGHSECSPILVRARALPGLFSWGLRFLAHSRRAKYLRNTIKNMRLAAFSKALLKSIREQEGLVYAERFDGAVFVFRSRSEHARYRQLLESLAPHGAVFRELDRDGVVAQEPALEPVAGDLHGGFYYPGDEAGDAYSFCRQLAEIGLRFGVRFEYNTTVERLDRDGLGARVVTADGALQADAIVLAAGSYSTRLARSVGINLPVAPDKGYSISVPMQGWDNPPRQVIADMGLHAGINPLGDVLRVAGTAEFAGFNLDMSQGRVDNLIALVEQVLPEFAMQMDRSAITPWTGLRPMSADGVAIIGATRLDNLFLNTGHGALGWTLAAGSSKALCDLIAGSPREFDLSDYSLARFGF